jgi:hypothetical protein
MNQHVCPLIVGIVGDQKSRRLGVVRVQGFDDLGSLAVVSLGSQRELRSAPLSLEQHTCRGTVLISRILGSCWFHIHDDGARRLGREVGSSKQPLDD